MIIIIQKVAHINFWRLSIFITSFTPLSILTESKRRMNYLWKNFSQNEVAYNVPEATDKTKVIISYDVLMLRKNNQSLKFTLITKNKKANFK